jgi:hypothetical protein
MITKLEKVLYTTHHFCSCSSVTRGNIELDLSLSEYMKPKRIGVKICYES